MTTLIISNKEMESMMKIIASLEGSVLLINCVSKIIEDEVKEQKRGFLVILFGISGANLLGYLLEGKGDIRAEQT